MSLDALLRVMSRKQIRSVMECEARINVWHGAVSSGKTIASLLAFLFAVVRAPENGLIFIVARTLQTAERNILEVLQQATGPFGPFASYIHHTRGSNVAVIFGRTVHIIGASDVRAEGRIRGATASLIYVDEASLIPEAFFTMCLSRLRVPGAKLLATTNPDGPAHWLRRTFLLRPELNMRQWQFVLDDNPALTENYKRDLKAEYVGLFHRRFILGEWCLAEGAVYDAWDPEQHVVKTLPHIAQWVGLGIDYGTTNPFAALLLGVSDGRLYLTHEFRYDSKLERGQLTDAEYSERLRAWLKCVPVPGSPGLVGVTPPWTVIDPSAASFRVQLHHDGHPSMLANNAVMPGIRLMSSLIARRLLLVHESCVGFISEVAGYAWDPKAAEKGEDAPIKVDDHSLDAARYVVKSTEGLWRPQIPQLADLPSAA